MREKSAEIGPGVIWSVVRTAGLRWGPLMAPTAMVVVPLALVVSLVYVPVVGDHGTIVNDEITPVGTSTPRLVWALASVVLLGAGGLVAGAAGLLVAAGHLLDSPVRARDAVRAAARRLPALAVTSLMLALPIAASVVLALVWANADGPLWLIVTAVSVAGFAGLPYLLLLFPAVVLERTSPLRALAVARKTFVERGFRTRVGLIVLVGLSVGAATLLGRVLEPGEGRFELAPESLSGPLIAMILVPMWSAAIAVAYLRQRTRPLFAKPAYDAGADLDRVQRVLADVAGDRPTNAVRARLLPILALALFAPNLVMAGLARLDPYGIPAMSEHAVAADVDGRIRVGGAGEADVLPLRGDRLAIVNRPFVTAGFSLTTCADVGCARSESELNDFSKRRAVSRHPPGFVALDDGTPVAAVWTFDDKTYDSLSLRLYRCDGGVCGRPSSGVIARSEPDAHGSFWTSAARAEDGTLVFAHAGGSDNSPLRLTFCADAGCSRPRTVDTGFLSHWFTRGGMGLTSDGRPVIAAGHDDHGLTVITCDSPVCGNPTISRPIGTTRSIRDLDIAIGADDRPAILFRQLEDGPGADHGTRFVRCSDPACRKATDVDLPGLQSRPALALDSTDRALITGTDDAYGNPLGRSEPALLLSCRDRACRSRAEESLGVLGGGFNVKDLAIGPGDRLQIVWAGARDAGEDRRLHVTTCRRPRCGAP